MARPRPDTLTGLARIAVAAVMVQFLILSGGSSTSAQVPAQGWGDSPPEGAGTYFLVWHGGSLEQAVDLPDLRSLWVLLDGAFEGYTSDAPPFVNSAFLARFPDGTIPPRTPVVVVIGPPTPGAVANRDALDFGETCVWCDSSAALELRPAAASVSIRSIRVTGAASDQFTVERGCMKVLRAPCEVEVAFEPFQPDRSDATLEVRHSGSNSPLIIPLRGFGSCERPSTQRVAMLDDVVGFGRSATGGAEGCLVRVTSLADEGAGTLREAAERPGPSWIVFDVAGTIRLDGYLRVSRDKTIDGRDERIVIERAGLAVIDTPNVVMTNLIIRDVREDGVHIRGERATDIWVSHLTIGNVADGYIDITQGAGDVTVSWSRFDRSPDWPQEKTLLVGLDHIARPNTPGDSSEMTRVTLHHNLFNGTEQRSPLVRGSIVHTFNNYFNGWGIYGSAVGSGGRLLTERNVYEHHDRLHPDRAFTPWDEAAHNGGATAFIRSIDDRFLNGASGKESNPASVPAPGYAYQAAAPNDALIDAILSGAGAR